VLLRLLPDMYRSPPENARGKITELVTVNGWGRAGIVATKSGLLPRRCASAKSIQQRKPTGLAVIYLRHHILLAILAEKLFAIVAEREIAELVRGLDAGAFGHA